MVDRLFQVASLFIAMISSLLTLLEVHLMLLRRHFEFLRRKHDIVALLTLPASGGMRINNSLGARQNLDGSGQDQDEL